MQITTDSIGGVILILLLIACSGFLVGGLARWLMPGPDPMSWGKTILLGIAGSFIGGIVGRIVGILPPGNVLGSFLLNIGGAMLVLWLYKKYRTHPV